MQSRQILSRILAALATLILSVLFNGVGDAIYAHDMSALTMSVVLILPAIVLGAPFAIPIALMVRVQNTWAAVPFVAIAGAIGIEAQERVFRLFADSSTISGWLMFVWVIPAILGTLAALLFKWRRRWASWGFATITIVTAIVLAIQGSNRARELAPIYSAAESWSKLRVGMRVYTGQEGNASGQAVCRTLARLYARQRDPVSPCGLVAQGSPAIVDAVIPCKKTDPNWGYESPQVQLHAVDGSLKGFTDAGILQPDVPVGTLISMQRDWGAPLVIESENGHMTILGSSATVRLLRYDPKRDASLNVIVLDGAYRNQTGWMGIQNADTGGVALGNYALQYAYKSCRKGQPWWLP